MSQNGLPVLALCVFLTAMTSAATPSNSDASAEFAKLSDQFMKESLALSPTNASAAGYHKHVDAKTGKTIELDAMLDDLSLDAIKQQRAFYVHWRDRFHNETPLSSVSAEDAADWQ